MKPLLPLIKGAYDKLLGKAPVVLSAEVSSTVPAVEEPLIHTMTKKNLDFLIDVLSVPTKYRQELAMINYLVNYLEQKGYNYYVDKAGNVYATKGYAENMPCVVAHIDTVHDPVHMNIMQEEDVLYALDDNNSPIGIGGDDKNGVYIALRLLEEFDNIKVAFFVSEEIGCIGSRNSDVNFFANVGYVIQFDAPEDFMVTHYCDGIMLFDVNGTFYKTIEPIIRKHFGDKMRLFKHPYTDVSILKQLHNISCINLSCGYYRMHSRSEYVRIDIIEDSVLLGKEMITILGENLYTLEVKKRAW